MAESVSIRLRNVDAVSILVLVAAADLLLLHVQPPLAHGVELARVPRDVVPAGGGVRALRALEGLVLGAVVDVVRVDVAHVVGQVALRLGPGEED